MVPAGVGLAGDPGPTASQRSTGGVLRVFEISIGAGPLHGHDREDEWFHVLDGELSHPLLGGDAFGAAAGSFVFLPRRWPHRFWAVGRPARLLLIAVPGGIEYYFHEINTASTDDERHRIGKRYDIRMIPG